MSEFDKYRTDKEGEVHISNEDLEGCGVSFYPLGDEENPNKFGIKMILPESVMKRIDFEKMESGEHAPGYYTMGQMLEAMVVMSRQLQLHPNCVEITNFDGTTHDVSDVGLRELLGEMAGAMGADAEAAYEREKEQGIVPDGLSFEDWLSFHDLEPTGSKH